MLVNVTGYTGRETDPDIVIVSKHKESYVTATSQTPALQRQKWRRQETDELGVIMHRISDHTMSRPDYTCI